MGSGLLSTFDCWLGTFVATGAIGYLFKTEAGRDGEDGVVELGREVGEFKDDEGLSDKLKNFSTRLTSCSSSETLLKLSCCRLVSDIWE